VLDVGAGTGKLTRQLLRTGAHVVAVEPIDAMRRELDRMVPEVESLAGTAEAIPLGDATVDAITAGQAYHWFDPERALPELHRVLRPGGGIALVWNTRDLDDPLQAAVDALLHSASIDTSAHVSGSLHDDFAGSGLFTPIEERRFRHEQRVTRETLVDTIASRSYVAALPDARRAAFLDRVRTFAGGQTEPIVLRYVTEVFICFRQTGRG
jgi:ubiquinone/menaquinone biosynthesis C-methylase UbiE